MKIAGRKSRRNATTREWQRKNPEKVKLTHRKWKAANQEKARGWIRRWWLIKKYGITLEEHAAMIVSQKGGCAICEKPFVKYPCVDHDHISKKVRGLLCLKCNAGLGQFNDSEALLTAAARYLKRQCLNQSSS